LRRWDRKNKRNKRKIKEKSISLTIKNAVNSSDADLLDVLLKQKHLCRDQYKYLSNGLCRNKVRNPHTLLTYTINRGDSECIRMILTNIFCGYIYPTIVDHVCSNGRTALWYACSKGDFHLVRELVERGHANINKCGILIVAAQNDHEKIVDYLLSKGCDPNRRAKNYNERALHAASRRNHLGILKALLKHGANPHILDYKKRTALDYAIHKRHMEIAKVLIYHQRGRFIMTQTGFTPLMLAARCNNTPIVDMLLDMIKRIAISKEL
jgi:ankyrin repeat protein